MWVDVYWPLSVTSLAARQTDRCELWPPVCLSAQRDSEGPSAPMAGTPGEHCSGGGAGGGAGAGLLLAGAEKLVLRLLQSMTVIASHAVIATLSPLLSAALALALAREGGGGRAAKWSNLLLLLKLCRLTLSSLRQADETPPTAPPLSPECFCPSEGAASSAPAAVSSCSLHTASQLLSSRQHVCAAEIWLLRVCE